MNMEIGKQLGKFLHDQIWEGDQEETSVPVPSSTPSIHTIGPISLGPISSNAQVFTVSSEGNGMYEKLKSKTDFNQSPALSKIFAFEEPLTEVITDPQLRLKAALAQAIKQGTTREMITQDFTALEERIGACDSEFKKLISESKETVASDEKHAADLETQLRELRISVGDRKSKLERAETDFSVAINRRRSDLQQLKTRFI